MFIKIFSHRSYWRMRIGYEYCYHVYAPQYQNDIEGIFVYVAMISECPIKTSFKEKFQSVYFIYFFWAKIKN